MNFKKVITTLLLSGGMALFAHNHTGFEKVEIKTIKVNNGIYMLVGKGGNIGLSVGEDGVFMIDDQFAPLSAKIKSAIAKLSNKPVKFMINTHWHYDHTGGNKSLGEDGAILVSHENVRKRLSKDSFIKAFNKTVPASPKVALPIVTFKENINFYFNDEEIEVLHQANAHTDGDSIIFFKNSNVIHTGDVYFNGFYPFIDESSDGDIKGVIKSVNYILSRINDKTKIIPGHGKLSNKKELIYYRDTLVEIEKRLSKLINEGKSVEEVLALKPLKDIDKKLGSGFLNPENFLKITYNVMLKNSK